MEAGCCGEVEVNEGLDANAEPEEDYARRGEMRVGGPL